MVTMVVKPNIKGGTLFKLVFVLLWSLITSHVYAATLEAKVDRETIIDGESIVLYITGSDLGSFPDTSQLLSSFKIVHSGEAISNSIINGKRTAGFEIRLELQPIRTGTVTIPAFAVGNVSSDPIIIGVVPRGTPGVEPRDRVFAEVSVDNDSPYVQEQVILSLRIFDDVGLASADPVFEGNGELQVEPMPRSGEVLEVRDGIQYRVYTFRYAVFPQKSGDVTIDALKIPASIRDKSFGGNLILRNTPIRRIEMQTTPLTLKVKPRAADNTSGWWLPVKSLDLKHNWSEDIKEAKAGEPFTLTFELLATGATATQLPEIPVPDIPGLKIYTDTPQLGSRPEQDNLVSLRREKWSVIPSKSGLITLPEIVIKWWDTKDDVEREIVFAAQELNIAAGEQDAEQTSVVPADNTPTTENVTQATDTNTNEGQLPITADIQATGDTQVSAANRMFGSAEYQPRLWQWVAIAAMLAWLFTLLAWWWSRRTKPEISSVVDNSQASEDQYWKEVKALSRSQDAKAYETAVVQWAQARWPESGVHNLPAVGGRLGSRELSDTARQLDQQRYSGHEYGGAIGPAQIQALLEGALKNEKQRISLQPSDPLPRL